METYANKMLFIYDTCVAYGSEKDEDEEGGLSI